MNLRHPFGACDKEWVMADDSERLKQGHQEEPAGEMTEREIDATLADTFPASDPPSWTLGTDHKKDLPDSEKDEV
jgi:hypothetical protein